MDETRCARELAVCKKVIGRSACHQHARIAR